MNLNQCKCDEKTTDREGTRGTACPKNGATKSDLLVNVWKYKTDLNTHTLESLIYRLRKKIEKDPNNPQILVQIDKKYFLKIST